MSPLTVDASTLFESIRVMEIAPLTLSAMISPLVSETLMPSLTELTLTLPRAPSTTICPSIDFALTNPVPPLMTMSPRTLSAETSACAPSMVMKLNCPSTLIGIHPGAVMS